MDLARQLEGCVRLLKVGSQLFTAEGPRVVEQLAGLGFEIFLDLKFHDIPNTVAGSVAVAASLPGVRLLTLHASGGLEMMQAAREAVARTGNPPKLVAVTVLTSFNSAGLRKMGITAPPAVQVVKLAKLARKAGMDGVVSSGQEARAVRRACGPDFTLVVPGIRPATAKTHDQARVATPGAAIRAGADYLVVGRPITEAGDPAKAARAILSEIDSALA